MHERMEAMFVLTTDLNQYEVSGMVDYYTEKNYGADADGNRGWTQTFVDDYEIESIVNKKRKNVELIHRISKETLDKIYAWFEELI